MMIGMKNDGERAANHVLKLIAPWNSAIGITVFVKSIESQSRVDRYLIISHQRCYRESYGTPQPSLFILVVTAYCLWLRLIRGIDRLTV
jgi:hypothetical protein